MNLRISSIVSILLLGTSLQAATLTLTTKYGATGGLAGDFNSVGNQVNGRNICPNVNDNSNGTPGCDMSGDAGYNNHGTDDPHDDYYTGDLVVRTNDSFELGASYSWTGTKGEDEVTIKGILPAVTGFIWDGIPGSCDVGLSSLSADRKVINCVRKGADSVNGNNVGSYSETMWFAVKVEGDAPNGSKPGDISIELSETTGTAGTLTDGVLDGNDDNKLIITSSPRWNIDGYGGPGYYTTSYGQTDPDGNKGWYLWYNFTVEVDEVYKEADDPINPSLGNEALKGAKDATVSFTADLSKVSPNAKLVTWEPDNGNAYFKGGQACTMDAYTNSDEPYAIANATYPDRSILTDKGVRTVSCTANGQKVDIKIDHMDGTLTDAPIKNQYGGLLPVTRKIASIGVMRVFVPLSDVEAGKDGIKGNDDDGELVTTNCYDDFNPLGISGTANFNGENESKNDNCYNITLYASKGSWRKDFRKGWSDQADQRAIWNREGETFSWSYPPTDAAVVWGGDGTVTPDGHWGTYTIYQNTGGTDLDNPMICDVIDTETYMMELLDPKTDNPGTFLDDRIHAVDLNYGPTETVPGLKLEYAVGYVGSWPPNPDESPGYAVAEECNATSITWYPDFVEASTHGAVSKVRVSAPTVPVQKYIAMRIKHKARSNYLTSGEPIPNKALLVNYATYKSDLTDNKYISIGYMPHNADANHEGGVSGDRLTMQRAKVRVLKDMNPVAVSPGSEPVVTLTPSFTNDSLNPESDNVQIVDVLPEGLVYKNGSTSGTYADSLDYGEPKVLEATDENCNLYAEAIVDLNHPCGTLNSGTGKETILVWDLGIQETGTVFTDLNFTTTVTIDAPKGVLANYAQVESPADDSASSKRVDNANVNNSVPSALLIVKSVQTPLHEINRGGDLNWMEFRVGLRNGSSSDLTDLDVIDVLPFNGDGVEGSFEFTPQDGTTVDRSREPATSYDGNFSFDSLSFDDNGVCSARGIKYWYTKASAPLDISPKSTTNTNADGTLTDIWCEGDTNGVDAGCGFDNKEVTAVRTRGVDVPGSATCFLNLKFSTNNNSDGDVYSNTAGASAKDNTGTYLDGVLSNTVSARVYASSLGDTVWYDRDANGMQDDGEIGLDGVTVNLYKDDILIATTKTLNGGKYGFKNLLSGDGYVVEVVAGDEYLITSQNSGENTAIDSDIDSNGTTDKITLGEDEHNIKIDAGLTTPILSGTLFDDGNGDENINGNAISVADTTVLYVSLVDSNNNVLAVKPLVNGGYVFDGLDGVRSNSDYKVVLSSIQGVVDQPAPEAELPVGWNHADGENINSKGAGNDGKKDGIIAVSVGTTDVPQVDFGINVKPIATSVVEPSQLNLGDEIQVDVPNLVVTDREDGTPKTITIKTLPNNATLYYNGEKITASKTIENFDNSKLKIDPADGELTAVFTYSTTDAVGVESNVATVTMPFTGLVISGNVFADGSGNNIIDGKKISNDDISLSVTLLDADNNILATKAVSADGSYAFDSADDIEPNKNYSVVLSKESDATTSTLPVNWNHADGEHIGLDEGTDGTADGVISVSVVEADIPQINFGINKRPEALNKDIAPRLNPGRDIKVVLPELPIKDNEDGVPTTITIKTLATNGTLYYNDVAVTEGQVISNYDPALLTVDPISGEPTVEFTYTTTDRVNVESEVATVTYPFTGISISGNLFEDGNGDGKINGTKIDKADGAQLYAMLLDEDGTLITSMPIDATGAYLFTAASGNIEPNMNYSVVISTEENATTSTLPTDWKHNDGEGIGSRGVDAVADATPDGKIAVSVEEISIPEINFGINKRPVAKDKEEEEQLNPGQETQVVVPTLDLSDTEDTTPSTVTIKSLPNNGTLYYNGVEVTVDQVIPLFDNTLLTVDPIDGNQIVEFVYSTTDASGYESENARVTIPFRGLEISGHLYDDGNNDGDVNGTLIAQAGSVQLFINLLNDKGEVIATQMLPEDGNYSFDGNDTVTANTSYSLVLTTAEDLNSSNLPSGWNYTDGENIGLLGTDGEPDGTIVVETLEVNIPEINFGINEAPKAIDKSMPSRLNMGKNVPVGLLNISDREDGKPSMITIKSVPNNGTLYYNGSRLGAGQVINDFNNALLTVQPEPRGTPTLVFTYTTMDRAGIESNVARVNVPFTGLSISGNLYADGNNDGNINGKGINEAGDTPLYVTLLDSRGMVLSSRPLDSDGSYSFDSNDGINANSDYTIVLSDTSRATSANLPSNWNHSDGENIGFEGTDGEADGIISVSVETENIPEINFGINARPIAKNVETSVEDNPGGEKQVPVIDLDVEDNEDGTSLTVTILTLPTAGTLYYDGVEVTEGQVISNFDNSKLTVNPLNGEQVIVFTYSTTDSTGWESEPARVRMPFAAVAAGEYFNIQDDVVKANPDGTETVIDVLGNDELGEGHSIHLLNNEEGAILWGNGTAVGGANVETTERLVVAGEGVWEVIDGKIVFTAEDGFTGTPSPIYYVVKDEHGNQTNVAEVIIEDNCSCEPYVVNASDAVPVLNAFGILTMIILTSLFSLLFRREELELQ